MLLSLTAKGRARLYRPRDDVTGPGDEDEEVVELSVRQEEAGTVACEALAARVALNWTECALTWTR